MPCKKIIFNIDFDSMDFAADAIEKFSLASEKRLVLYKDPIACLRETLGLRIDVSGGKSIEKADGIFCSSAVGFALKKNPTFKDLLIVCPVDITRKNGNSLLNLKELVTSGIDCLVIGKPVVYSAEEINGLTALFHIIYHEVDPESTKKKSFKEKCCAPQ